MVVISEECDYTDQDGGAGEQRWGGFGLVWQ